jgi:hypothetical protein
MWNEINTKDDIENLMKIFGCFHDSCIKEIKYISGAYVDSDLRMKAVNDKRTLRIIFQRQYKNPNVIEMEFEGLEMLYLPPLGIKYSCNLYDATFFRENEKFYWADCSGLKLDELQEYEGTWLCANKAKWREKDEYIGDKEIY